MRYLFVDKVKAMNAGFRVIAHRYNDKLMLVNENEVMNNAKLTGTLKERALALGGEICTQSETFLKIQKKKKYKL